MFNTWQGPGFQVLRWQEGHEISVQLRQTHFLQQFTEARLMSILLLLQSRPCLSDTVRRHPVL